jgi:GNAT superfamily N-acetyltransferase
MPMGTDKPQVDYRVSPPVDDADLNRLFAAAWHPHRERQFGPTISRSLAYICAYHGGRLIGFVNVAWDGGKHGFLLDTTVAPEHRRRGVGTELVRQAVQVAAQAGLGWLHVDYEPQLGGFYRRCGFRPTEAGVMDLSEAQ